MAESELGDSLGASVVAWIGGGEVFLVVGSAFTVTYFMVDAADDSSCDDFSVVYFELGIGVVDFDFNLVAAVFFLVGVVAMNVVSGMRFFFVGFVSGIFVLATYPAVLEMDGVDSMFTVLEILFCIVVGRYVSDWAKLIGFVGWVFGAEAVIRFVTIDGVNDDPCDNF